MKKYIKYVLHGVILVGVIVAAVRYLNGEEVLNALTTFNYIYMPVMLLLAASYIAAKGWRFAWMMEPISRLPQDVFVRGYVAGTAATLVPAGVAARAGIMNQAGVSVAKSSAPVAFSSIMDQAVFVAAALLSALFFPPVRVPAMIVLSIVVVIGLALAIPFTRSALAKAAEWIARKIKIQDHWHQFLNAVDDILQPKIIAAAIIITIFGLAVQVMILDLTLRGFGQAVAYPTLFLAYTVPTMFGRLSGLPGGGVGVTEAGIVGFLSTSAQIDPETSLAAAAIFRVSTVLFQALLGAIIYFFFWKGEGEKSVRKETEQG